MVEKTANAKTSEKLMVVGKTSKAAADWIPKFKKHQFQCLMTSVGAAKISNRFEAVAVICEDQDDLDMMIDMLVRFETCPVVFFIGNIAMPAEFPNSRLFQTNKVADCAKAIKDKIKSTKVTIGKVFDSFDKDGSGCIDKGELKAVVSQLGLTMGNADVNNMMEDLDLDKNGIIEREEFELWWMSGRKGTTASASQLVMAQLGGKAFFDTLNVAGKKLAKEVTKKQYKHISQKLDVMFNGGKIVQNQGIHINIQAMSFGKASQKARQEMSARVRVHQEVPDNSVFFSIAIKLKEDFTDKNGFFESLSTSSIMKDAPMQLTIKFESGHLIITGVTQVDKNEAAVAANELFQNQDCDQNQQVDLRFGFSFEDLYAEEAPALPEFFMKGFTLHKEFNMWEGFHKVMIKLFEDMKEGDQRSTILFNMLAPLLPFYVFKVNGNLEIDLDPDDVRILLEMPQAEMANVNVHNLLTSMSPWGTIDDMELIQNDDEEAELPPIWSTFEGHTDWESPDEAAQAFLDKFQEEVIGKEQDLGDVFRLDVIETLIPHALSLLVGDEMEFEFSGNPNGAQFHMKTHLRSKGLSHFFKTNMLMKASGMM